jgi:hypothetical protein
MHNVRQEVTELLHSVPDEGSKFKLRPPVSQRLIFFDRPHHKQY